MNTLPALPPVVYLAGRYMTSLDMFMAKVRDVLSSTRRNVLMEQEHLLALYRDGVLFNWLRALSPTDHRAGSMHRSMEKMMQQTMTDTEAKKALGNLFGAKEARVTALRFDEYLELLPACVIETGTESYTNSIWDDISIDDISIVEEGVKMVNITLSFRVLKAANDIIVVSLGPVSEKLSLQTKGKIHTVIFNIMVPDGDEALLALISGTQNIHKFTFNRGWVDLGFGTKWATCNVGAKRPEEVGCYFAWGDIRIRHSFQPDNYPGINMSNISGTKYECATSIKGPKWKMPLKRDWNKLMSQCKSEIVNTAHGCGMRLISRINGKSIFLPCGGHMDYRKIEEPRRLYYWSSIQDDSIDAFTQNGEYCSKWKGLPVRPIYIG